MDGLLLWVMLYDINDREPAHGEQMFIRSIPNGTSSRGRVVKVHAHARLLRTLPGEDVDGRRLSNLSSSVDYLFATLVHGLNFDHHIAITHASMGELDAQLVMGEDHTNKCNVVSANQKMLYGLSPSNKAQNKNLHDDMLRLAFSDNSPILASSTGPHVMSNGTQQGSEITEVRIDVDRVIVA